MDEHMRIVGGDGEETAAASLCALCRLKGVPLDRERVARELGDAAVDGKKLARLAREIGLEARFARVPRGRLNASTLPAIAALRDGEFVLLARVDEARVLVMEPVTGRPAEWSRADFDARWTGRLMTARRPATRDGGPEKFGFAWFLPFIERHKAVLFEVLMISLFVQLFGLMTPMFSMVVIDKVLSSSHVDTLDVLVVGMGAMAVFDTLMGILRSVLLSNTTNRIDVALGARLFDHLTSLPAAYFESRPVGALAARVRELESIRAFLTGPALTAGLDVLFAIVFLAIMLSFSVPLTGVVALALLGFLLLHAVAAPFAARRTREKFSRGADAQSFLVEAVGGVETLRATAAERQLSRRWRELLVDNTRASLRAQALSETTGQLTAFINKLMSVGVLWYGAHLVIDHSITAGTLIAFNMMAGRVGAPILRLTQIGQQIQQAVVAMRKVADVMNAQPEPGASGRRTAPGEIEGRVVFRDVTFRYDPRGPATLDGVSFEVPAGRVVGVVGLSGSGKSTLVKLIQRLYVPERGAVLVDGVDLAGADPRWLRRQIGVVPQDVVLFNRSVRENVALADPSLPAERVIAAARLAGAHDFIVGLPDGYDTQIGERGARLSGGQRQRLALARALIHDPRILILDEATSSLDYESEAVIHRNMRRIRAGRTVFVVAHRLAALRDVDRVLVLDRGRLVEEGTHAELVASGGRYAALHAFQIGAATPADPPESRRILETAE